LIVAVGEGLSDQRHRNRTELWVFHSSGGKVTLEYPDGRKVILVPSVGSEILIPVGVWHMLECIPSALSALRVTEVSFGNFDEHDEERRLDRYGRKK
jgi:mannose-6-phosphate isomerase-like protein (cupin superfamily)